MAKKDSVEMLKNKIEVLKRTKKNFKKAPVGTYPGLCSAINSSYHWLDEEHLEKAANQLVDYISKSLKSNTYLYYWLHWNRPNLLTDGSKMKKYRLQWLDWMIACLEEDLQEKQNAKHP